MKPNSYEIKVVKRCPKCNWRIFDKVTPTSGIIELKCPNCRKIVEIDLSYRTPIRRRATYYRASYLHIRVNVNRIRKLIAPSHGSLDKEVYETPNCRALRRKGYCKVYLSS